MKRIDACDDCGDDRAMRTDCDGICATYDCVTCGGFVAEIPIHAGD